MAEICREEYHKLNLLSLSLSLCLANCGLCLVSSRVSRDLYRMTMPTLTSIYLVSGQGFISPPPTPLGEVLCAVTQQAKAAAEAEQQSLSLPLFPFCSASTTLLFILC